MGSDCISSCVCNSRKNIPCKFQQVDRCKKGARCQFSHDPSVLAANCPRGLDCPFLLEQDFSKKCPWHHRMPSVPQNEVISFADTDHTVTNVAIIAQLSSSIEDPSPAAGGVAEAEEEEQQRCSTSKKYNDRKSFEPQLQSKDSCSSSCDCSTVNSENIEPQQPKSCCRSPSSNCDCASAKSCDHKKDSQDNSKLKSSSSSDKSPESFSRAKYYFSSSLSADKSPGGSTIVNTIGVQARIQKKAAIFEDENRFSDLENDDDEEPDDDDDEKLDQKDGDVVIAKMKNMKNGNSLSSAQHSFTSCPDNLDKHQRKKGTQILKEKLRKTDDDDEQKLGQKEEHIVNTKMENMKNENSSSSARPTFTDCPGNADPKKKGVQIPKKKPRRNKKGNSNKTIPANEANKDGSNGNAQTSIFTINRARETTVKDEDDLDLNIFKRSNFLEEQKLQSFLKLPFGNKNEETVKMLAKARSMKVDDFKQRYFISFASAAIQQGLTTVKEVRQYIEQQMKQQFGFLQLDY